MIQRLIEINDADLEWWYGDDIKRIYGLINVFANGKLYPIFIISRISLIDYQRIEVINGSKFTYTR